MKFSEMSIELKFTTDSNLYLFENFIFGKVIDIIYPLQCNIYHNISFRSTVILNYISVDSNKTQL